MAQGLDAVLERIKNNETQLKLLELERDNLKQKALLEVENEINADFILQGIKKTEK